MNITNCDIKVKEFQLLSYTSLEPSSIPPLQSVVPLTGKILAVRAVRCVLGACNGL